MSDRRGYLRKTCQMMKDALIILRWGIRFLGNIKDWL